MITRERLKELLYYDLMTGEFTWKESRGSNKVGSTAGSIFATNSGYQRILIGIDGKHYYAHRLAFLWMLGYMPEQIDHINHDAIDNRWINLRPANHSINKKNMSLCKRNTSGHIGVSRCANSNKWWAKISVNGKYINLGRFDNIEDAIEAREVGNVKYGFHENHGK